MTNITKKDDVYNELEEYNFKFDTFLYFVIFVASVAALFSSIYFFYDRVIEEVRIDSTFSVVDRVGYNPKVDQGNFGKITPGNTSVKVITVTNKFSYPVKVRSYAYGDLEGILYGDTNLVIDANQSKDFSFFLEIPKDYNYGDYEGEIVLKFRKA